MIIKLWNVFSDITAWQSVFLYSQIFQKEVGLNYVHIWKSVNIRGIPK